MLRKEDTTKDRRHTCSRTCRPNRHLNRRRRVLHAPHGMCEQLVRSTFDQRGANEGCAATARRVLAPSCVVSCGATRNVRHKWAKEPENKKMYEERRGQGEGGSAFYGVVVTLAVGASVPATLDRVAVCHEGS